MQQNECHDSCSERAKSIVQNIFFNKIVNKFNPFFNKELIEEKQTDYQMKDLVSLNQLSLKDYQSYLTISEHNSTKNINADMLPYNQNILNA